MANTDSKDVVSVQPARVAKPGPRQPLALVGRLGGSFAVDGEGFGDAGTLMVGGRVLETTSWRDHSVRGQLPAVLPPGKVSLKPNNGDEQTGEFPYVAPLAPTPAATK